MDGASEVVHATAIAVGGRAALIRGPSGAGKSDLALRCLAMGPSPLLSQPAELVADDQVRLERVGNRLRASAPAAIAGKLEVRGIGILTLPAVPAADVVVLVELVAAEKVERMPGPNSVATILGLELPILRLAPAEPSAPAKLLVALATELGRSTPSGRAVEENPCVCCEPL